MSSQAELRQQLKQKYGNESVLVVPIEDLPSLKEGFLMANDELLDSIDNKSGFMFRYLVEYNADFRQPIPYILIKHEDKYFATRRLTGSGESRLHGKISLGVGGHVNPEDLWPRNHTLENAIYRELDEELNIDTDDDIESVTSKGFINDNSNEVSQDHIGVIYTVNLLHDKVTVKEIDKLEGRFYTVDELRQQYDDLESWSQLVLEELILE